MRRLIVLLLLPLAATVAACGSTKTIAGPTVHVYSTISETETVQVTTTPTKVVATHVLTKTVTYTPVPAVAFTDGTLVIGTDVQPGIYKTDGQGDGCYWARLSSLNTDDIIDNGNISGPTTIQIEPSDKAIETSGGCAWTRIG